MRNNDDLKVWFENTGKRIIIDNEKKTKILETLSGEVSKKKIRYVSNWSQIVRSQLYYMDKSSWLIECTTATLSPNILGNSNDTSTLQ